MSKNIFKGFAALVIGLLSTACADRLEPTFLNESTKDNTVAENTMVFHASLEQPQGGTKTALGAEGAVVWTADDEIMVFNASHPEGATFTLTDGAGQVSGSFSGDDIGAGPYYAVYPASAAIHSNEYPNPYINLTIPSTQNYVANSFGNGANISWATSEATDDLFFRNLCGAVAVTVTGSATIKKVNLYSRGGDQLNGVLHLTTGDGNVAFLGVNHEANQCVTLDCGEGVALGGEKTFYITVPGDVFEDGFFVELIDVANTAMIKSAGAGGVNLVDYSVINQLPAFAYTAKYSAAFLQETNDFGAYSAVTGSGTKLSANQFASQSVAGVPGSRSVRFQNWTDGYSFSLNIMLPIEHNQAVAVDVENLLGDVPGAIGAAAVSKEMKVIKKFGNRAWIVDAATSVGYVVRLTD